MALVAGTNSGFVTTAPTSDPEGGYNINTVDEKVVATHDTSPATATKITEIGWWCNNATEESNFEVGVYTNDSGKPNVLLAGSSQTNAKGTGAGWKVVTGLNITISPETDYHIAFQLDNTATESKTDWDWTGNNGEYKDASTLPSPWGDAGSSLPGIISIYAVWEAAPTPPVAAFSGTPTSGEAPLTVQFTDTSTNTPTSWLWDFGDTTGSILENPENIYASAGDFTVTLTATNDDGSDDEEKTDYITVTAPPAVVAEVKKTGKRHFRWQEEEEEKPKPIPKKVNIPALSLNLRKDMDSTLRRIL